MSVVTDVNDKLNEVKDKVEGDLKILVEKLESIFQHIQASPVEDVVKNAVAEDVDAAATTVEHVSDSIRSDVDSVDNAVDTTAK